MVKAEKIYLGLTERGEDVRSLMVGTVERVSCVVRLHTAVVFGSRARQDYKPWSDIDLLIVAEGMPEGFERLRLFYSMREGPIEPRAYTKNELFKGIRSGDVCIWDALMEGLVIVDDGTWGEARRLFNELKEAYGLKKDKLGWRVARKNRKA